MTYKDLYELRKTWSKVSDGLIRCAETLDTSDVGCGTLDTHVIYDCEGFVNGLFEILETEVQE